MKDRFLVLLVMREKWVNESLTHILEAQKYEISPDTDCQGTLISVKRRKPELAIVDESLTGIDRLENVVVDQLAALSSPSETCRSSSDSSSGMTNSATRIWCAGWNRWWSGQSSRSATANGLNR